MMGLVSRRALLGVALSFVMASCNPFGEDSAGAGLCSTTGINTHRFAGSWKKVYGYATPRTDEELETNFDLMLIEPGDRMCEAEVINSAQTNANYRALFAIDVNDRTISVQYDENNAPAPDATPTVVRYSFSDSCDETKLILRYPNGTFEKYEIFGTSVPIGSCDPQ
jgi:hypothetical protein